MGTGRHWLRSGQVFLHNGSTPTTQDSVKLFTNVAGESTLRQRHHIQLSVVAGGAGAGVDFGYWTECLVAVALWRNSGAIAPAVSPTPLTNINQSPEYLQWEILVPTLQLLDTATPSQVVTWGPKDGVIETFSHRKSELSLVTTTWLCWEILDPSGLINTTSAGITYNLGGFAAVNELDEVP